MTRWKRSLLMFALLISCVGCDQVTKEFARTYLAGGPPLSWFHDLFRLEYAENAGAFLSLGTSLPQPARFIVFQVAVGAGLAALMIYLTCAQRHSMAFTIGIGLIVAGGIGNFIDRVSHQGHVVDFMNLGVGPFRTGIFNFADVFITVGAATMIWLSLRQVQQPGSG